MTSELGRRRSTGALLVYRPGSCTALPGLDLAALAPRSRPQAGGRRARAISSGAISSGAMSSGAVLARFAIFTSGLMLFVVGAALDFGAQRWNGALVMAGGQRPCG
jgi:hypothetical protein